MAKLEDQRRALLSKEAEITALQEKHKMEMASKDDEIQNRKAEINTLKKALKKHEKNVRKLRKSLPCRN